MNKTANKNKSKRAIVINAIPISVEKPFEKLSYKTKAKKILSLVLSSISHEKLKIYDNLVKNKRLSFSKKLNVISYVLSGCDDSKKPFCFLSKKEKINKVRKIGLKTKGDISVSPVRIMPDEEFLLESSGSRRKVFDSFDKLPLDKKIDWARAASQALGKDDERIRVNVFGTYRVGEYMSIIGRVNIAMKYACKVVGIPYFRGRFSKPEWICFRSKKFSGLMKDSESDAFLKAIGVYKSKNTIKIIDRNDVIDQLEETLKNMGIYKEYKKKYGKCSVEDRTKIASYLIMPNKVSKPSFLRLLEDNND